ncbi:MAG: DUF4339 domain-containing protein [Verrucomicrobiales bacterium]|jgi:hypothetical protein|nr:DUF4339 domain-containing protein [Verrucomicrobiales bacterium]
MSNYYVSNKDQVEGPFALEQIEQAIRSHRYLPPLTVRKEGEDMWLPFAAAKAKAVQEQNLDRIKQHIVSGQSVTRPTNQLAPTGADEATVSYCEIVAAVVAVVTILLGICHVIGGWLVIGSNGERTAAAVILLLCTGGAILFSGLLIAFCFWLAARHFDVLCRIEKRLGKQPNNQ